MKKYKGVRWVENSQRWVVGISDMDKEGDKRISLGSYTNYEDAINARKQAEVKYGYYVGDFMEDFKNGITQKLLKSIINYNPDTGVMIWACTLDGHKIKGRVVGSTDTDERIGGKTYVRTTIANVSYSLHRLAFLYMTGSMPVEVVDHIDGDGTNNKWANLRQATIKENNRNTRLRVDNTSGVTGVSWRGDCRKWVVVIADKHRGLYASKDLAIKRAKEVYKELEFSQGHGTKRAL